MMKHRIQHRTLGIVTIVLVAVTNAFGCLELTSAEPTDLRIGASCQSNADCPGGFCSDGVCCNEPCTETCKTCNHSDKPGICVNVSVGQEDPGTCEGSKACGAQLGSPCKLKLGESCTENEECLSGDCSASDICVVD